MLKFILISLALIIVVFVIIVALQPADFRVTRSATIAAPPAVVFGHVNDLHLWQDWSPWAKLDPNAKNSFDGPPAGTGARMNWNGNNEVGEGAMTITESRPGEFVGFLLEFKRPFAASNTADFTFKPDGNQTVVTWGMSGKNNFMFKAVGLFMNCDKMLGPQFEKGLADLKTVSEAEAKK
jgi:carbon monoxide dehydrogenase subunit G